MPASSTSLAVGKSYAVSIANARAVGVELVDVARWSAGWSVSGAHAASPIRAPARPSARVRAQRPGPSSRRRPGAWSCSGHSSSSPPGTTSVTRFVSVPKPLPSSATSLATSRSTPLRVAFSRARERTRLGREPDHERRRCGSSGARLRRPRRGCRSSARARGSVPRRPSILPCAIVSRPEVGDGGGHHQRIRRRRTAASTARRASRRRSARERSAPLGQRPRDVIRGSASPRRHDPGRPRRSRRPSCRGAVADVADRIDRLRRAAGGHHDAPARQVRARARQRRRAAERPRPAPDRLSFERPTDRVDDRRGLRQPAPADRPDASGPTSGSTIV